MLPRPVALGLVVSLVGAGCGDSPDPRSAAAPAPADVRAPAPEAPAPVAAPVVAAPPPAPCRIVRAVYRRGESSVYALERAEASVAAASLADWSVDGAAAPPLFGAAALDGMAKTEHGALAVNDAGLTIARDREGRQALASVATDAGATLTLYVYLYACDEVPVDTLPTADEGSVPVPRYAASEVPVHPAPGASASGARKVRKGAEIRFDRSRVIVKTPAVAAVRSSSARTVQALDPATGKYAEKEVTLKLPAGGVLYLYDDEGEGMCLLGDGATIGSADCSDLPTLVAEPFASLGPQPIEATWWLRLRDGSEAWIEASPAHVDARERRSEHEGD